MHIFHITNSYGGTEVYTNLYKSIDSIDVVQTVFVPLNANNHDRVGNKLIDFKNNSSKIIYSTELKSHHRFFYGLKIRSVVSSILRQVDIRTVDVIHASTLCFDGAVAYNLNKKYGIPYIVAVRNTDVNIYYKKIAWKRGYFAKILKNASRIIFISPKYKENFIDQYIPETIRDSIISKMMVIPNGVNNIYLETTNSQIHSIGYEIRLIFVGAFYKGKGLIETIQAIEVLRRRGINITLNAIGEGLPNRPQDAKYVQQVKQLSEGKSWLKLKPFKKPQEIIEEMRKSDIFVMVSSPETFGLVYVEALTQNLPIIYAKNQGFDGFFPNGYVGYSAKAGDLEDIQKAIEELMANYIEISKNIQAVDLHKDFEWTSIGEKYKAIYKEIL